MPNILAEILRGVLKFEEVKVCLKQRVILVGKVFFKNLKMLFFLQQSQSHSRRLLQATCNKMKTTSDMLGPHDHFLYINPLLTPTQWLEVSWEP